MDVHGAAAPAAAFGRICRVGFTTFVIRAYEDIVRYFFLTIAPPAVTTALYFAVFGALIGHRIGSVGGFRYMQYIAPGLILLPVILGSYSQAGLSFAVAKIHRIIDEHLVSPQPAWMIVVSYVTGGRSGESWWARRRRSSRCSSRASTSNTSSRRLERCF